MRLKMVFAALCLVLVVFVFTGCASSGLSIDDFVQAYNKMNDANCVMKTVSYNVEGETLYNKKIMSRGTVAGQDVISLYEYNKRLNELTFENVGKFEITESQKYYYNNQIGEVVDNEIIWRAGLLEELTNQWGGGTRTSFKKSYITDIVINKDLKTLEATVQEGYYQHILSSNVSDLTVKIVLDNAYKLSNIYYNYIYEGRSFEISLEISFKPVSIEIDLH